MIPTQKIIRPIVSVDIATNISAMLMTLGGALVSSYRGLNPMIIIGSAGAQVIEQAKFRKLFWIGTKNAIKFGEKINKMQK